MKAAVMMRPYLDVRCRSAPHFAAERNGGSQLDLAETGLSTFERLAEAADIVTKRRAQ